MIGVYEQYSIVHYDCSLFADLPTGIADLFTGIAIAAVLFVVAIMCVIAIAVVVIFSNKRKRSMWQ